MLRTKTVKVGQPPQDCGFTWGEYDAESDDNKWLCEAVTSTWGLLIYGPTDEAEKVRVDPCGDDEYQVAIYGGFSVELPPYIFDLVVAAVTSAYEEFGDEYGEED